MIYMPKEIEQIKEFAGPNSLMNLDKLDAEMTKLKEAMLEGDRASIVLKGSDVCLSAIRAEASGLITENIRNSWIECMASLTHAPKHILLRYCVLKLSRVKAGSPMNSAAKRHAITHMLWGFFIGEAQAIRYLIVKSGGMANKSKVEDVLMARHQGMGRNEAHDITNQVEFMNETWFRIGNPTIWIWSSVAEPKMEDYPEIKEVL